MEIVGHPSIILERRYQKMSGRRISSGDGESADDETWKTKQNCAPKRVLRLPDLAHAKLSVLNTMRSPESERAYRFAIDDFISWYCSQSRIAFNKTVVLRYRIQLEAKHLAPSTINLRLAAVRRLAYEAIDVGLLTPDVAAIGSVPNRQSS